MVTQGPEIGVLDQYLTKHEFLSIRICLEVSDLCLHIFSYFLYSRRRICLTGVNLNIIVVIG